MGNEWTIFGMESKRKKKKDKKKKEVKMTYSELVKNGEVGLYHCETTQDPKIKALLYKRKVGFPLVVSELADLKMTDYKKYLNKMGCENNTLMYESKVTKLDISETDMKSLIKVINCQIDKAEELKAKFDSDRLKKKLKGIMEDE